MSAHGIQFSWEEEVVSQAGVDHTLVPDPEQDQANQAPVQVQFKGDSIDIDGHVNNDTNSEIKTQNDTSERQITADDRAEIVSIDKFKPSTVEIGVKTRCVIKCKSGSPCLALVNRCASTVARHDGRLLWLTYHVEEEVVEKTFHMVGYNTGEPDIMAGMSRNKCGGEPSSGFMKTFVELQPPGLKVVVALCMTRNIVGANCYVTDELITSRARVKIRMVNMDAVDSMVMIDVLCKANELALSDPDPQMANLTWHGCLGLGDYSIIIIINNGDMGKISTLSMEDWDFMADKSEEFVSVLQCENALSNRSPRDNQMRGAFMVQDKHMVKVITKKPLKYSHLDLAGTAGNLSHPTTGSVVALTDAKIEAVGDDFGQLEAEECFLELVISKSIKKVLVTKIVKMKENLQV